MSQDDSARALVGTCLRTTMPRSSLVTTTLVGNIYVEDDLSRFQNRALAAGCVWKTLNQRVSAGGATCQCKCSCAALPKALAMIADIGEGHFSDVPAFMLVSQLGHAENTSMRKHGP